MQRGDGADDELLDRQGLRRGDVVVRQVLHQYEAVLGCPGEHRCLLGDQELRDPHAGAGEMGEHPGLVGDRQVPPGPEPLEDVPSAVLRGDRPELAAG